MSHRAALISVSSATSASSAGDCGQLVRGGLFQQGQLGPDVGLLGRVADPRRLDPQDGDLVDQLAGRDGCEDGHQETPAIRRCRAASTTSSGSAAMSCP